MMLAGSGDVRPLVSRPLVTLWLATHAALLAVLVVNARATPQAQAVYWAFWYPVAIGAMQTLLLRPLAPTSKKPTVIAVAAVVLGISSLWFYLIAFFLTVMTIGWIAPWIVLDRDAVFRLSPALGGMVAGLTQWWVLHRSWHGASFLAPLHALLALSLNMLVVGWFGGRVLASLPDPGEERVVVGALAGLALAAFSGLALLNLRRRA
ncbi:MAG: hypothetical protein IT306_12015 [Chloroflexi bacterium]|nr:hypothetical protein [Chloroflexota bacterium]